MKDNLENFIANHRNEFDDKEPSGKVWQNIEATFSSAKKTKKYRLVFFKWAVAAAVLALGLFIYLQFETKKDIPAITKNDQEDIEQLVPDEYVPEVTSFSKLVNMKQEELKSLSKEQPELYQQFTADIVQLDSSYNALKRQLSSSPNKEIIIEALIQNLQLQLNVLNQQLSIIHQVKQTNKKV